MKNIFEILSNSGIEVPEDKKTELTKQIAENYRTVAEFDKVKNRLEVERDNYKDSLETAQNALQSNLMVWISRSLMVRSHNSLPIWKKKDSEYQTKIADMEFNSVLDSAISASGARNSKAVEALLEIEALKGSKNQEDDIKKAIEAVKTENDFLFGADEPINNVVIGAGNSNQPGKKMTLMEAMAYKNAHPEADVNNLI